MPQCAQCGRSVDGPGPLCPACRAATQSIPATRTLSSHPLRQEGEPPGLASGAVFADRYRIVDRLGRGGMGVVYRAIDLRLNQPVALKFLTGASTTPALVERFRNEVRLARQVTHPSVCRVYDLGEAGDQIFLSMEYIDGEDLASLLRRIGRLPEDKAIEISRRLCAGLAAAHDKGVLHRDLKPANVMLDSKGEVRLTDFGLASLDSGVEGAEARNGTPAYMAPEQLAGKEATVRSDIYSLGLVLYELFTGRRPFEANSFAELLHARQASSPPTPSSVVSNLDPAIERVILRCLEPDPRRRPASALAVAAALPGGDPLAAALAAGETPSPGLVASVGEGSFLSLRIAIPVVAAVLVAIVLHAVLSERLSALTILRPAKPPEVLTQKARDVVAAAGYPGNAADEVFSFEWDDDEVQYLQSHGRTAPESLLSRPLPLHFWYRRANAPLLATHVHDDSLTPGLTAPDDPPPIDPGMIGIWLDSDGRLIKFTAVPPRRQPPEPNPPQPPNFAPLFAAAQLDPAQLHPDSPQWSFLGPSDARFAWTGNWPGSQLPLRVEAASWRGLPMGFALFPPWSSGWPSPAAPSAPNSAMDFRVILSAVLLMVAAPIFARWNLKRGRGDRRGAFTIAAFTFAVMLAIFLLRAHFAPSAGAFGLGVLALSAALFYAALLWAIYMALEPYVRRHWPRTLVSWSLALQGRLKEPVVGRDILFGIALGLCWVLISDGDNYFARGLDGLSFPPAVALNGARVNAGHLLLGLPSSIRSTLLFFFVLFLLRVLLRNAWLAGAAFVVIFSSPAMVQDATTLHAAANVLVYALAALAVVRFGLVPLSVAVFIDGVLLSSPASLDPSAWYFPQAIWPLAAVAALAAWSFYFSVGGSRAFSRDWLG